MARPEGVAPGAYRVDAIGLPNSISVLLVEGDDGWTLVDAGVRGSAERIREALLALGGRPEDLRRIYLTHHHIDHIGGLPGVRGWAPGAEVMASEHEAMIVSGERNPDRSSGLAFRLANRVMKLPRVPVDRVVAEGETVAGFRVLLTPGHTLGHTSLLRDEDGLLFTADAFGAMVSKVKVGGLKAACTDPPLAKRSSEKILAEEFDTVVMTHGKPIHAGARRRLKEAVDRCDYG